jgi:hypothetical protein
MVTGAWKNAPSEATNARPQSIQYFAKVTANDHEVFQRTVKHYPGASYADWHMREAARMAEWRARRHAIKMVPITPKEFADHCAKTGKPSDIITFKAFLIDKASF